MVPLHICRSPMPWGLMHPIPSQRLAFPLFVDSNLDGHLRHVESEIRFFLKQAKMWTHLTREHVSTVLRSITDDFGPRELGGIPAQN